MKTREQYESALAKFRHFGRGVVRERKWTDVKGREPYAHGWLEVAGGVDDAQRDGADLACLAATVSGYLVGSFQGSGVLWSLAVSRPLDAQDAAESAPVSA